jgi:predicted PurR-regulated permease PerM
MSFPAPTPKQARLIWFALTGLAISLLVAMGVILVWGLGLLLGILSPVLWPLAVAGVMAYLLDPVVDYFQAKGLPRTRAIACVFALALFFLLGLAGSVVPQLVTETRDLATRIPSYASKLRHRAEKWVTNPPAIVRKFLNRPAPASGATNNAAAPPTELATTNPAPVAPSTTNRVDSVWDQALDRGTLQSATDWLAKIIPKFGSWIFGQMSKVASWFGVLAGLALIPIYAFYFLLEKKGIESKWTDYLPVAKSGFKDELVFILRSINGYLIVFFRSQVLVAICDGVLYTIGFVLIGLPYAVLLGVLAIALTMIPFLGAMATCAMALILAFVQYGDWQHPALVLGVFAVVQTLEGLFISPKIMGDRVGLHPLTIIVAVMVGTTVLGGILGGVLAIPLTAAGRVLMFRYVWRKREPEERVVST